MKAIMLFSASVLLVSLLTAYCFADLPGFGPRTRNYGVPRYVDPPNAIRVVIEAADDIDEPTLELPLSLLHKGEKVAFNTPAAVPFTGGPILAAGALALCFAGGAAFVPGMRRKFVCVAGLMLACGAMFALRQPDVAAEPPAAAIARPIALPPELDAGTVHITVLNSGDVARLRLPRKKLPALAKQLKEATP